MRVREWHIWAIVFCGLLSGGSWGIIEAVWRLAGTANGSYDALFWGYCFYGGAGVVLSLGIYPIDYFIMSRFRLSLRWSLYFCLIFCGLFGWVTPIGWGLLLVPISVWFLDILLRRSPLKIVPSFKGGIALSLVLFVLSAVFSLTTGPVRRPLELPNSYKTQHPNVLIMALEGLRTDDVAQLAPSIADLRSRSLRFEQTYSDSLDSQKAMIALLGGQHRWLHHDIDDSFVSLAEIFLSEGYHTAAVVNDLELGLHSGLDQGFEHYTFLPAHSPLPFTEGARRLKIIGILLDFWAYIGHDPGRYHRSSFEMLSKLKTSLHSFGDENWFAYVQLRELEPPFFFEDVSRFRRAKKHEEHDAYRERLRHLDGALGTFWRWLEDYVGEQDTIVILISTKSVSFMHEEPNFEVPLSIFIPRHHAKSIQHEAQLIDIPSTLASLLSFKSEFWNGIDLLHGGQKYQQRPIFSHTPQGWSMVQHEGWRYMLDKRNGEGRLYNVVQDPNLKKNLWDDEPQMRNKLQKFFQEQP